MWKKSWVSLILSWISPANCLKYKAHHYISVISIHKLCVKDSTHLVRAGIRVPFSMEIHLQMGILSTLQNASSSSVSNLHVLPYWGEFLDQMPLIGFNKPIVNDNCLTFWRENNELWLSSFTHEIMKHLEKSNKEKFK